MKWPFTLTALAFLLGGLLSCKEGMIQPGRATADTTSHSFTWRNDTLGDGSSSVLNDVAVISDNDIWAVGEIYLKDSTGAFETVPYSAAVWNGSLWQLRRFFYQDQNGSQNIIAPIRGIWAFGPNDIWLAAGSVFHFNGTTIESFLLRQTILGGSETVEKLWGISGSNLYGVGNAGTIVHFDGNSWQKLSTGMTVDVQDIWGSVVNSQTEILAISSFRAQIPQARELIAIQGPTPIPISDSGLPMDLSSIWFISGLEYYLAGDGLYSTTNLTQSWSIDNTQPLIYKFAVRGVAHNDIFIVGAYGLVSHFNGTSWKQYADVELPSFYGSYKALSFNGKTMAAVGWLNDNAVTLIGDRN